MKAVELARYADASYRQIDYWCSRGYLVPGSSLTNPGSGTDREFSEEQAKKARMMVCLVKLGFELQLAEKIASFAAAGEFHLHLGHGVTLKIEEHTHS